MTLTARFEAYTVTPVTDAKGTVRAGAMQADGFVTIAAEPKRGYHFAGWKIDERIVSYDNPYTFIPKQDTEIVAVFETNEPEAIYHSVTINGNKIQIEAGKTINQPADPVKIGYRFIGWYIGENGYDFSQPVISDLTITPKFEKIKTLGAGGSDHDKPGTNTKKPRSSKRHLRMITQQYKLETRAAR